MEAQWDSMLFCQRVCVTSCLWDLEKWISGHESSTYPDQTECSGLRVAFDTICQVLWASKFELRRVGRIPSVQRSAAGKACPKCICEPFAGMPLIVSLYLSQSPSVSLNGRRTSFLFYFLLKKNVLLLLWSCISINWSFSFGGLTTLFHCSIPVQGSQYNITSEKLSHGFICAHFSLHNSLFLSLSQVWVS